MASNQEESFSNLEDRNQMGTTCTATAPIYVEGTPSREIMFRLPPLENMGPSVTTEQSFGEGDMPVLRHSEYAKQLSQPSRSNNLSYRTHTGLVTSSSRIDTIGMGVRPDFCSNLNFDTVPSISTATRCSSGSLEASRNLSSHENAFGHYEPYRDHSSAGQVPSTKGLKPGTFDGLGNWTDYLIQFNLIADYYHWSNYDRALQLATHLRGTAQGVLSDLSQEQRTNFNSLVSALAARFEPVQQSELYRAKIKSRVRRKGEPIVELAQDIRKLIRLAYPSATTEVREQLSKDCFIDALNDHDLEWAVLQGKPFSVEDALKLALEYEAFQRGRRGRYNEVRPFSTAPEVQEMGPETHRGNAQQAAQSNQNGYSNRSEYKRGAKRNGQRKQCNFCRRLGHDEGDCYQKKNLQNKRTCYYCNSTGHFIRDCKMRQRDFQNYGHQGQVNHVTGNRANNNQSVRNSSQSGNDL